MNVVAPGKANPITASQLYDLIQCPHRLSRDLHGDPTQRDAINAFVQLLWERGSKFENEVIASLKRPFLNLRPYSGIEKERRTLEAMRGQEPLIYGGRISADDLLGEPDLLAWQDGGYVAGDIKSGAGLESTPDDDEDGKPKKHYAAQLALYSDILVRLGFARAKKPFIWDIHGQEVIYDLEEPVTKTAKQSFWEFYQEILAQARQIRDQELETEPAYSSTCKLCHWYTSCKNRLIETDDITLLPDVGRAKKILLQPFFGSTKEMAERDLAEFNQGKKSGLNIKGIGYNSLVKFQQRAQLRQSGGQPYFIDPLALPSAPVELFYDIEVDPLRELCYLHGVVERLPDGNEKFYGFMLDDPTAAEEERIFAEMIDFLRQRQNWIMYYYSPYERTWWRKLQVRYPHLLSSDDVDAVFKAEPAKSLDLYHQVATKMVWPTIDHSIKTLAKYFGFNWRDNNPSGAASVEWFDTWVNSRATADRQRIIDYNEDDCVAMGVMLDGVRGL